MKIQKAPGMEVGRNPELMYPIKLGGTLCSAPVLEACVEGEVDAADACCTELFDEDSDAAEELISNLMAIAFAGIIPGLILLVRGFLLGRLWDKRISEECQQAQNRDPLEGAWGKKRWHLRVGFYSLDTCLGLTASLATALAFTAVTKVLTGRPRPNYFALRAFSERAASGKDYVVESVLGWPSRTAAVSMAGLLFLAFVLWRDLMALVQWRRRSHPRVTLVLAVLGGFALATVPLAAILMGITRIRDFWHRPDDVLAGLVLGAVCAFWSFRFVVVMPFNHEIGAPEWTPEPTWVLEEEDALLEDSMMGCWKVGRKRPGGVGDAGAGGGVSRAPRPRVVHGESPAPLKFDSQPPQPPMQVSQATIDASAMKDDDSQA